MDNKTYSIYLEDLNNRLFKIIPLCEECNKHIDKYIETLVMELKGLPKLYPEVLEAQTAWYVKVASTLLTFDEDYSLFELHSEESFPRIRRQVFTMMNLVSKEKRIKDELL